MSRRATPMWPRDGGDSRRITPPKAAAGKGVRAGATWRSTTAVEGLRTHVKSKGAFGMLAVGRHV